MTKQPVKKAPKQEIPEPANIHEAINHVMGRVGYVQKERNKNLKYTFASEPAFIKAVRPHLVDVGLIVYQSGVEFLGRNEIVAGSGAIGINVRYKFEWTWVHVPSETSITVTSIGEGTDYGDKASNKAMTAAMKYNMRQTLVIETGDDPDTTPSDDYEQDSKTPSVAQHAQQSKEKATPIEERPYHPFFVKERVGAKVAHYKGEGKDSNEKQFGLTMGCLNLCFAGDKQSEGKRKSVLAFLFGVDSGKDLSGPQVLALLDWLEPTKDSGDAYAPSAFAVKEATKIVAARIKELGQDALFPGEPE